MENYIDELNQFTENKYNFTLKSATLKQAADFCELEIYYNDGEMLTIELKKQIEDFTTSNLPKKFKYNLKFFKRYVSKERVQDEVNQIMNKNFPSISYSLENVEEKSAMSFEIFMNVDELSFEHAKKKNLDNKICELLKNKFINYNFELKYEKGEIYKEDKLKTLKESYKEEDVDIYEKRKITVTEPLPLIGEEFELVADYIKDKTKPQEAVTLCGKIKNIKEIIVKRKPKQTDKDTAAETQEKEPQEPQVEADPETNEAEPEIKYQRKIYKIILEDFTGEITCIIFSTKETQAKLEKLDVGSEILIRGNIEFDEYSKAMTCKIKDLAYCKLPDTFKEYIEYRTEKPFYEFVEPEKLVTYQQDDLMSFAEVKTTPDYLKNKTFVCYDLETTGLHYEQGDKMIEIGAVKIVDGKITERFLTFVDPEMHIPEESSAVSGIVDDDVKGAPKDFEALQDFYKWTRGAIIIGYNNINFDNVFLIEQGKAARWNFDNETDDVYKWAQKYVNGVKNYKLKTIADSLGVTLDNAHRAVYDALATAEVFIKIHEINNETIKNSKI